MSLTDRIQEAVGGIIPTYGYTPDFRGGKDLERHIVDNFAGDAESNYAHYALHKLHILPSAFADMPIRERAFLYASIDLQIKEEKRAQNRIKK